MKKLFLLITLISFFSCNQNTNLSVNPSFDSNVKLVKQWFKLWETEDLEKISSMISDSVKWQGCFYGQPLMTNKSDLVNYINKWHVAMENITYNPKNFLSGVDSETNKLNGSVRSYGTWSGKNTATGKEFEVLFYHYFGFDENGKIVYGGDYGDATGVMMAVAPDQE